MAKIPKVLHSHIDTAFPANVCLVGSVLPDGFAQITPRGGTMVYDDEHIALWERGKGSTNANLRDGTALTVYFRKPQLREEGVLPKGGIARLYGRAKVYKSGPVYRRSLAPPGPAGKRPRPAKGGLCRADRHRARRGPRRPAADARLTTARARAGGQRAGLAFSRARRCSASLAPRSRARRYHARAALGSARWVHRWNRCRKNGS